MSWVEEAATRLCATGPAEPDGLLDGHPLMVRPVDPGRHRPLFGSAVGFYMRVPVPVVQLVWPDAGGRRPWEEAASSGCRAQPRLRLPVAAHPPGVRTDEAARTPAPDPDGPRAPRPLRDHHPRT